MTTTSTSTLENSAETQIPARSLSEIPSLARNERVKRSSTSAMNTAQTGTRGGNIVKNKRTRYSTYQTETLKKIFETTQYPDFEQLAAISRELALDKEVVKIWFKNRRARQKSKEQENACRHFLERESSSLPAHFRCPMPICYFPMYSVVPSPWQPMMNYHGNTAFGLYDRPTSIFEGPFNANPYQNRLNAAAVQEHRSNEPAVQREFDPRSSH